MKYLLFAGRVMIGFAFLASAAQAQTNFVTLTSDGAWTWFNDPRALFHNGKLYFGYDRDADGKTVLSVLDLQSGGVTNLWASGYSQTDDHDVPGLLAKEDGTMLAVYSRHLSDQYFYYRLSDDTDPVTPADWNTEQRIASSGDSMTYANPVQLAAESGKIYNFCRNQNYNPTIYTSTDGGTTWSSPEILIQNGSGNIRPYVKYASNYTNRIDFLYTDGHPREVVTNSLYEMYYQNGAFYRTDGTFIKNYADLPILHQADERGSVIYQYSTAPQSDPNEWIPGGRSWCWEIGYQTNGAPACVFSVQLTNVTGSTQGLDDRIYYYYACWTGTNWQKRFIAQAGRPLYAAENDYAGGICLDPQDVNTIYISTDAADPFDLSTTTAVPLGAHFEIWRGVTTNGGWSFNWQAVTANSTVDNLRPYVPRRFGGEPCVLWFRGTYASYTSFNTEIVGLSTTQVPQANAASGTWIADADGLWSDKSSWFGGIIAEGAGNTADFSTLDITADRSVTLDSPRRVGALRFGDVSGGQNWLLDSSNGASLTLDSGFGVSPSIVVAANNATIQVPLAGTNGFTKSGPGTLILAASNSIAGALNLDRGMDGNNDDGATRITSDSAIADFSSVNIRNTSVSTAGGATLQLDGAAGGIVVTQTISATCRNNSTTPTFESLAGANTLAGTNFIQVGGTNVIYQSEAGSLLRITAPIQYVGTLTAARFFTFTGAGDVTVSGPILTASNNVTPIAVVKTGDGTLMLSGANTYTNGTAVLGGTLIYNGSVNLGRVTVSGGTLGGTGTIGGAITIQAGGVLSPGAVNGVIRTLTISNALNLAGTTFMALDPSGGTNDSVRGLSAVTCGGTLMLTNLSGTYSSNNVFKLFSAASYVGAFTGLVPSRPAPGFAWNTNTLATDGALRVVQTASSTPTNINVSVSGDRLMLSWPTNYLGWRLQAQTNDIRAGLGANWLDVPGSNLTNQIIMPLDPAGGAAFYRMVFP
jgi:autotransporter-associated beta strand protein